MSEAIENKDIETEIAEAAAEKPYTFRTLEAGDIMPMVNIIRKLGIKEFMSYFKGDNLKDVVKAFSGGNTADAENEGGNTADAFITGVGMSIAFDLLEIILNNLEKCEDDIFKFLAGISNLDVESVRKFSLAVFTEMILDFFAKEDFKDFMKVVSKLFK